MRIIQTTSRCVILPTCTYPNIGIVKTLGNNCSFRARICRRRRTIIPRISQQATPPKKVKYAHDGKRFAHANQSPEANFEPIRVAAGVSAVRARGQNTLSRNESLVMLIGDWLVRLPKLNHRPIDASGFCCELPRLIRPLEARMVVPYTRKTSRGLRIVPASSNITITTVELTEQAQDLAKALNPIHEPALAKDGLQIFLSGKSAGTNFRKGTPGDCSAIISIFGTLRKGSWRKLHGRKR